MTKIFTHKELELRVKELEKEVTKLKQTEEALLKAEEQYRTVFESTGTATITGDENTTILMVNSEFEKLSGYSKQEIERKKSWSEFVIEEDLEKIKNFHRLRRIDPSAAPRNHEFRFINKEGEIRHIFATVAMIPGTKTGVSSFSDITDRKLIEEERAKLIEDLQEAVAEVKTLSGLLPICASCKKIRDDKGYWTQIESYIKDHSEAEFSHGICPECAKKLYPEFYKGD